MDFPESIKLYDKSIYRQFVELVDTLDGEDTDLIGHVIESETSEARLILDGEITFDRESPDPSVGFRGRYVPCFTTSPPPCRHTTKKNTHTSPL